MSEKTKREIFLTGLFAAFMFLQFAVLRLGNSAGEGYLSTQRRELVYYALQVFVILGFIGYAAFDRLPVGTRVRRGVAFFVLGVFCAGAAVLLAADRGSLFYLIVTLAVMPCLGGIGGAVYHRMSRETAAGAKTARSMGFGCSIAVVLQYLLQIQLGATPLLPVFMLAAFLWLTNLLLRAPRGLLSETEIEEAKETPPRRLMFACLIAATFMLFTSFYNGYIHHLQIRSGYTDYNVYSWPRLILVPCYLLFAAVGDRKQGKLVPIAALCVALVATLNSVLAGNDGAYWLNMCLFYCSIAASVSYYDLIFWRLAQGTKHPAFWASMGRILDSVMVLLAGALHISALPAAAVLAVNIAGIAAIVLLMTLGGDFDLTPMPLAASDEPRLLSTEDTLDRMREQYALTRREAEVLRELVLTEDKQTVISERLSIQVKTLQDYVTRLYRKTGAATRSGLTELYHACMTGK